MTNRYAQKYGELFSRHIDFPSVNSIMQATAEVEMSRFATDCYDVCSSLYSII